MRFESLIKSIIDGINVELLPSYSIKRNEM